MTNTASATPAPTPLVSASQITLYRECARKWAWKYLAHVEIPQGEFGALGDDVDASQLQPYLRDGREFDYTRESGYIAAAGLAYLPQPRAPGLEVQRHFVLSPPPPEGVSGAWVPRFAYQGYLDLWAPDGSIMPDAEPSSNGAPIPCVGDFKTTKDFRWAKTEAQLHEDVQANLYATWAMHFTGAREVDLAWIYFRTRGARKAKPTRTRVDAEHVVGQFLSIDRTANEMFAVRAAAPADDAVDNYVLSLPPTIAMCDQYGGCPYQARCNLGPVEAWDSLAAAHAARQSTQLIQLQTKEEIMADTASILAGLKLKKAGGPPTAAAPPPAPTESTTPALPINPPESALPPADPIGTIAPPPPTPEDAAAAPTKRGPGRPRKAPDAALPVGVIATPSGDGGPGTTFTLTWAEERYSPVQYQSFGVGPFAVTGAVQAGETLMEAMHRVAATLFAFATEQRGVHADAFKRALVRAAEAGAR